MQSVAEGFWNLDIQSTKTHPTLTGFQGTDVLIVGGGLSALWAAHDIKTLSPGTDVVILESDYIGFGPSGRSGGIVYDWWTSLPRLSRLLDPHSARQLAYFSEECLRDIRSLPDTEYKRSGVLHISTSPLYDNAAEATKQALTRAGRQDLFEELGPSDVQEMISSPRFRGGTLYPGVATVHPAKLVRALLKRVLQLGVLVYEGSEVISLESSGSGWLARTATGTARASAVLQATGASGPLRVPGFIASSSHMIVSEPVDDLERWWPSEAAATDERATVRYFRKTADNRIALGWGFGKADFAQDLSASGQQYQERVAQVFLQMFPFLEQTNLQYSWGGLIDISPTHLPIPVERMPGYWTVAGYTGNGIGGTRTMGRILASRILGRDDEAANFSLPKPLLPLPPDPLLQLAGNITREALLRREAALEKNRRPKLLARIISDLPGRLGIELGR